MGADGKREPWAGWSAGSGAVSLAPDGSDLEKVALHPCLPGAQAGSVGDGAEMVPEWS